MHREVITHMVYTRTDFLITASKDGIVKFWKKVHGSVNFVKQFRAHVLPFTGLSASCNGFFLVSVSKDQFFKVFDVENFDNIHQLKLPYVPGTCAFVSTSANPQRVAVADSTSGAIRIYKPQVA
jgi:peptidylprolyl isomerase domain and WD repeat-containing protein 1